MGTSGIGKGSSFKGSGSILILHKKSTSRSSLGPIYPSARKLNQSYWKEAQHGAKWQLRLTQKFLPQFRGPDVRLVRPAAPPRKVAPRISEPKQLDSEAQKEN